MRDETKCPQGVAKAEHALHCKCDHYLCWSDMRIQAELARLGPTSEFAARLKAHEALGEKVSCNDPRPGISHDWSCDDVTEVIHGALTRDAEHRAELDAVCNQRDQLMGKLNHVTWARPKVLAFSRLMESKLRENDHKGGWKDEPIRPLLRRLNEEVAELMGIVARRSEGGIERSIGREAADVANFAMMIADVCGALAAPPPAESTPVQRDQPDDIRERLDAFDTWRADAVGWGRDIERRIAALEAKGSDRCARADCGRPRRWGGHEGHHVFVAALEAKGEPGTHAFRCKDRHSKDRADCKTEGFDCVCDCGAKRNEHAKGAKP